MHANADKTQENKTQSAVNDTHQKQSSGESTFQVVNNRPEAIAQRKLQEMANNSSKVKRIAQLQTHASKCQVFQLMGESDFKALSNQFNANSLWPNFFSGADGVPKAYLT